MSTRLPLLLPDGFPPEYVPSPDDYVSMFTNDYGEQTVFIAYPSQPRAVVLHSDDAWLPHAVDGGLVETLVLSREELAFLGVCWRASVYLRHWAPDGSWQKQAESVAAEPRIQVTMRYLEEFSTCAHCTQPVVRVMGFGWTHLGTGETILSRRCKTAAAHLPTPTGRLIRSSWVAAPKK